MKALYFPGYNGRMKNQKTEMLARHFDDVTVIDPGDYTPQAYNEAIREANHLMNADRVVVGSSLGGYWALKYSAVYGVSFIVLNPILDPESDLYPLDSKLAQMYSSCPPHKANSRNPGLVIVSDKDHIINPNKTISKFAGYSNVVVLDSNSHQLNEVELYEREIKDFVYRQGTMNI